MTSPRRSQNRRSAGIPYGEKYRRSQKGGGTDVPKGTKAPEFPKEQRPGVPKGLVAPAFKGRDPRNPQSGKKRSIMKGEAATVVRMGQRPRDL